MSLSTLHAERDTLVSTFGYARFYAQLDAPAQSSGVAPANDTFCGWVVTGWRERPQQIVARYLNQAAEDRRRSQRRDIVTGYAAVYVYRDLARQQIAIARDIRLRERKIAAAQAKEPVSAKLQDMVREELMKLEEV